MRANIVTVVLVMAAIVLAAIHFSSMPWTATRVAAVIVGLPSLALFVLARTELGNSFSVRAKAQQLVTHGLYSRIRNPIYVFGGLVIASFLLYINQPYALLIFVVLIPMQIYRARKEEQVLEAKFGEEYREYKARTWF